MARRSASSAANGARRRRLRSCAGRGLRDGWDERHVCQAAGKSRSGRSRHGMPARWWKSTASTDSRSSLPVTPTRALRAVAPRPTPTGRRAKHGGAPLGSSQNRQSRSNRPERLSIPPPRTYRKSSRGMPFHELGARPHTTASGRAEHQPWRKSCSRVTRSAPGPWRSMACSHAANSSADRP